MVASLYSIPNKIWGIILCILFTPLLSGLFLGEKNIGAIWFLYLVAVVLASYFSGLRGGLVIAITNVAIHFSWELITGLKSVTIPFDHWILIPNTFLQLLLATSIGLLADKLKEKHNELESIFNSLDATIWSHDLKNDTIIISTGVELIYGYTGDEFAQDPSLWNKVVHPEDVEIVNEMNENALLGFPTNTEFRIIRPDGELRWVQDKATPIFDENNKLLRINGVVLDITERKQVEEKIKKLAYYDYLTGLPNRKYITQHLETLTEQSKHKIAVIFIDLDNVKLVNDTMGHEAGDILLKEVCKRMKQHLRLSDIMGRLGGDEFIILVEDLEKDEISSLAERIIAAASLPIEIDGKEANVTLSIGISLYPKDGNTYRDLIRNADFAMYVAKECGKNQYRFFQKAEYKIASPPKR